MRTKLLGFSLTELKNRSFQTNPKLRNVFNLFTVNYEQNCQEKVKYFSEMESKLLGQENELKQYKSLARKQQKQIKQLENSVSKLKVKNDSLCQTFLKDEANVVCVKSIKKEKFLKEGKTEPKFKQVVELMKDICVKKLEFNKKCQKLQLPFETLESFLYRYLHQKFGLEDIVLQWGSDIWDIVNRYSFEFPFVQMFGEVLKNQIDEGFLTMPDELQNAFEQLLVAHIKSKYPLKSVIEIRKLKERALKTSISVHTIGDILSYMYSEEDHDEIIQNLPEEGRIESVDLFDILLAFQVNKQKGYLQDFVAVFRQYDTKGSGMINLSGLCRLLADVNNFHNYDQQEDIEAIDANRIGRVTFSQCVDHLKKKIDLDMIPRR